ncbi:MAG: ATP-dependent DNA helicase RecQ [Spirochaetales bacterium]|nr:ATP-dependent DNA helicase RecQ [Spirochaetales bacterium]
MEQDDPVQKYATEAFGVRYLYPYQRLVVANVLDAASSADDDEKTNEPVRQMVILPTGAGKSLCFQLPARLCPGPTVVVYPLLGLMADQHRRLTAAGVGVVVLRGGMTEIERNSAFDAVRSGNASVVIANPETLAVPAVSAFLAGAGVFHFVVDEAHCVAEWGDSFRPAYLELGAAIQGIAPRVVTAFTATASPPVLSRVAEVLFGSNAYNLVEGSPDRPNIRYEVWPALSMRRAIREAVSTLPRPAIVFVRSRSSAQILAEDLRYTCSDADVRFYHAGLEKSERTLLEAWFMASDTGVLCSTCAYGMGMDKPNVRTVIHYGAPPSVESYLQESGRAGRDGEASFAVLLRASAPETMSVRARTAHPLVAARARAMEQYGSAPDGCRRAFLLRALGYRDADSLACSSCDRCDGKAREQADGEQLLQLAIRWHGRRLRKSEAAEFMTGSQASVAARYQGALAGWRRDEAEEAIDGALRAGIVRLIRWGPWKGRLVASRRHQSGRTSSSSSGASTSSGI